MPMIESGFADGKTTVGPNGDVLVSKLMGAADYLGNGAIETNRYETEIADIVRRDSVFLQRVDRVPATGHPHRYFDQTAIASGSFTDPRSINPTPTGPTRTERAAMIKAIVAQTNFGLFDVDVTRMQGQFAYVEGKDIEDITSGIIVTEAAAVWNGTDTSLTAPTTTQYVGLLTQITNQATIGLGASIIDGLKAKVAAMLANQAQKVRPTAIYLNPILSDLIDREAKAAHIDLKTAEVVAGVTVKYLSTQAGDIPLISDPFIPATTDTSYGFAARLGQLELFRRDPHGEDDRNAPRPWRRRQSQPPHLPAWSPGGLQGQYVGVHFNTVIAKLAGIAHAVVAVVRPTVTAG
jgi:hypothetical protein